MQKVMSHGKFIFRNYCRMDQLKFCVQLDVIEEKIVSFTFSSFLSSSLLHLFISKSASSTLHLYYTINDFCWGGNEVLLNSNFILTDMNCLLFNNIQLLTIEVLDMTLHPPENTNIHWGDSRGQYRYSVVDINVISNTSIVSNHFII